jgi:hypothetical protein
MGRNNRAAHGQAKAHAMRFGTVKRIKNLFKFSRGNSRAAIADRDPN